MTEDIRAILSEMYGEDLLFLDPPWQFDSCIVGIAERCGMDPIVAYDARAIHQALERDGMTKEEASEWFEFNMAGAYVGPRTPLFLHKLVTA